MKTLSINQHPRVTQIIHIADLHVRIGDRFHSRSDEYEHVFNNLYNELSELQSVREGSAIVVLCGDVAHSKCRLETSGTMVLFEWINKMLTIAPILVISGNHDFLQNDPSITDSIDVLVKPYQMTGSRYPIHYMKETGHYRWENIGFGVCSCKDTLKQFNTFGVVAELPTFPSPEELPDDVCKIALFHGSITQSALPNGRAVDAQMAGYPLEWFRGYKWALLGDVHLQQINTGLDGSLRWGYPGSLIQQDTGETTYGHGYLLWDIPGGSVTAHHIANDFGDITIVRTDLGGVNVRLSAKATVTFAEAIKNPNFPKTPKVRIIGSADGVVEMMAGHNILPSRLKVTHAAQSAGGGGGGDAGCTFNEHMANMSDMNTPKEWERYVKEVAPDIDVVKWIYDPKQLLISTDLPVDAQTICKIKTRNKGIQETLDAYDAQVQSGYRKQHALVLKRMQWSYLMCFGDNNYMDFEAVEGGISLLNGANATGKSSYLDVLCIALYGDPTASRSDTTEIKMSSGIIHVEKPESMTSGVKLVFEMDGDTYEIHRTFWAATNLKKGVRITTISRIVDGEMFIVADGAPTVNAWILARLGSLTDLLMSTVLCQMDNTSFFFQGGAKQKEVIDRSLNLGTIAAFQTIIEETIKAYKYVCNDIDAVRRGNAANLGETVEGLVGRLDTLRGELVETSSKIAEDAAAAASLLMKVGGGDVDMSIALNTAIKGLDGTDCKEEDEAERERIKTEYGALGNERDGLLKAAAAVGLVLGEGGVGSGAALAKAQQKAIRNIAIHDLEQPAKAVVTRAYIQQHIDEYNQWLADTGGVHVSVSGDIQKRRKELEQEWTAIHAEPVVKPDGYMPMLVVAGAKVPMATLIKARRMSMRALEAHNKNKPEQVRPRAVLESIQSAYAAWAKKQNPGWLADVDAARSLCKRLQAEVAAVSKRTDAISSSGVRPVGERPVGVLRSGVALEVGAPIQPQRPKAGYAKWKATLAAWKAQTVPTDSADTLRELKNDLLANTSRKRQLRTTIDGLKVDIETIKQVPFNSECWACCAHHKPAQERLVEKESALRAAIGEFNKIPKEASKKAMDQLDDSIGQREAYESRLDYMTTEEACWKAAAVEWKAEAEQTLIAWHLYDVWSAELDAVRQERDLKQKELVAITAFCQQADEQMRQGAGVGDELVACKRMEEWQTKCDDLAEQAFVDACNLWTVWSQWRARVESEMSKEKWTEFMAQAAILDAWEAWRETMDALEMESQWAGLRVAWVDVCGKYDTVGATIAQMNIVDKCRRRVWSHELAAIEARLSVMRSRAGELNSEIGKLSSLVGCQEVSYKKDADYAQALAGLQDTVMRLERFHVVFVGNKTNDGFKTDIYKRNVIPLIENVVNEFLSELDDIRLKMSFINGKFIYNVMDRGCCPAFDNASGYQKFLIGLAMRSTLSRIGAVGQSVKHLFIDEGFVSCDSANLLKVRDILVEVMRMGGYRSIILMSHQDAIREVAAYRIDINRDGGKFSAIQHGRPYPVFKRGVVALEGHPELTVMKRRGRPPKAKVNA